MNRVLGVVVPFLAVAGLIQATAISGSFRESLDAPDFGNGPRILENLKVDLSSAGPQLTAENEISNPTPWKGGLDVTFDQKTNILSLSPDQPADYQLITFVFGDLGFDLNERIVDIISLKTGNAVIPGSGKFSLFTSFTETSATITYTIDTFGQKDFFSLGNGPDVFQIVLGPIDETPEPGTNVMMTLGLVGLATFRKLQGLKDDP